MPTRQELVLQFMIALCENSTTNLGSPAEVYIVAESMADQYLAKAA